jgi:hypothetical protein
MTLLDSVIMNSERVGYDALGVSSDGGGDRGR